MKKSLSTMVATTRTVGPLLSAVLALLMMAATARAGGYFSSEFAVPDMGTAFAGTQARASDATTAVANPAGMTRLDDHQLLVGFAPGFSVVEFDPAPDTPTGGGSGGNQGGFLPIITGMYAHKLSDRWRLGLGILSTAGSALDPEDTWAGRQQMTKISLLSVSIYPTVAYRVTDWLSIGAGAAITYGKVDWDLSSPLPGGGEAPVKVEDATALAPAAFLSTLVEPTPTVRFGLIYQSETDLRYGGDVTIPAGVSARTTFDLPLPQLVRGDVFWQATDRVNLMLGAGWENWSTSAVVPITIGGASTQAQLGFKDTWKLRGGVHYRLNNAWLLQTGVSYDSSAVDTQDRLAALPLDRQWRVGIGTIHQWTQFLQLGLSFQWTSLGEAPLDNNVVKGKYGTNDVFFFNINANWKKLPWSGKGTF